MLPPLPLTALPQSSFLLFIHLPAALDSTGVTQLLSYYGSSDSWNSLRLLQVSLLTRTTLHCRSVVNHPIALLVLTCSFPRIMASPVPRELAVLSSRITFTLSATLGAPCYGPATHLQLLPTCPHGHAVTFSFTGQVLLRSGLPPLRVVRLAGARGRSFLTAVLRAGKIIDTKRDRIGVRKAR